MTRRRDEESNEAGIALITVLLVTMVLTTLIVGTLGFAAGSLNLSRHDQDWNAALSSAEAGIDDYIFRLNQGNNYWLYSRTRPPTDGNQAFAGYVKVPGAANEGEFTYTPDASTIATDGIIKLTVTGRVRKAARKLEVTLRRRSFLDYLYLTDFEVVDPSAVNPGASTAPCEVPGWAGRPNTCTKIVFANADVINGPLHSNDWLTIDGNTQFNGPVSTSWDDSAPPAGNGGGKFWVDNRGSGSNPLFDGVRASANPNPGRPQLKGALPLPPSNDQIKAEADPVVGGIGCLYTGPTKVTLRADKMDVVSPMTTASNPGCGPGNNLAQPRNGVIYVQTASAGTSCPAGGHPLGYPIAAGDTTPYGCVVGDAFVSGTLSGQMTIATENNITITGNLTYVDTAPTSTDVLGLVAQNFVQIYHPVNGSGSNLAGSLSNPQVNAAIVSLLHSFMVQKWANGVGLGNLTINGAIAQHFRGPVGTTGGTGYIKAYTYDARLKYLSPPHFIQPVSAAWEVKRWSELKQ